ncbi:MAG: homoserine dehydrogenase, partial [Deltaproteobacteria bacterium]
MKQVRIGLLGVGTVGQAVARALVERQDVLSRAAGTPLLLQRAAVRDLARPRGLPADRLTSDPAAVAAADDVDLVIELVGGEEPARSLITTALERGRPVVTANKRVLAWHGPQLAELAARRGVELRYEAAVGGGIPLIAPLTDDLAANRVLELRAIINGTCNYVLTRMASGESLEDALAKAQQAGYAEADPRDDVDAVDAGDKLVVLLRLAFDVECTPAQLHRQGIRGLDPRDLAYGRERSRGTGAPGVPSFGAPSGPRRRCVQRSARDRRSLRAGHVQRPGRRGRCHCERRARRRRARRPASRARRPGAAAASERSPAALASHGGGDDALLLPPLGRRRAGRVRADHPG